MIEENTHALVRCPACDKIVGCAHKPPRGSPTIYITGRGDCEHDVRTFLFFIAVGEAPLPPDVN